MAEEGVTRRTILRAAAWSTPLVAAAAVVPVAAASGTVTAQGGTYEWDSGSSTATAYVHFTTTGTVPMPAAGNTTVTVNGKLATVTAVGFTEFDWYARFSIVLPSAVAVAVVVTVAGTPSNTVTFSLGA